MFINKKQSRIKATILFVITVIILGCGSSKKDDDSTSENSNRQSIFNESTVISLSYDSLIQEGNEGITYATVIFTRSGEIDSSSILTFEYSDGTTTKGVDYIDQTIDVVFNPTDTTKEINLEILGDFTI